MTKILAPSNIGPTFRTLSGMRQSGMSHLPYEGGLLYEVTYLRSYKSPTQKSDGQAPTNYIFMISKLINGGAWDARSKDGFRKARNLSISDTCSVSATPHGCNLGTGRVSCPQWMLDRVIADARAEMNQLGVNILEDLGQLKQTGDMIAMIVKTIADLFLAARKGNWKYVRRALGRLGSNVPKRIANGWLMYFYGIRPLVNTIDALAESAKPIHRTLTVRKRQETAIDPRGYTDAGYWFNVKGSAKVQAQCQLSASIKMDGNTRQWAQLGLTSSLWTDAVVTAWALVPYSFVFDWFVPVEQFLRSLSWSPSLEYQGGFTGKRHVANASLSDPWPSSGLWPFGGKLPTYNLQVRFYQRTTYPYSVPPVYLSLRLTLSSTQIINAAALITTRS